MFRIGVAPITQVTHVRNKYYSNIQGRSLKVIKSGFPYYKVLLKKEIIRSLWKQILFFKRSSHLNRDAIEENNCLIKKSPFDVRNFFSVLATPLLPELKQTVSWRRFF